MFDHVGVTATFLVPRTRRRVPAALRTGGDLPRQHQRDPTDSPRSNAPRVPSGRPSTRRGRPAAANALSLAPVRLVCDGWGPLDRRAATTVHHHL